ncbi:hypothetical protein [Pseudomonas petrae]|uniref:hypothetical protein n=1 Tax=Pseudomonas petrae TaxID=2912190 RepID=UPI001F3C2A4B|nr:hypothetical protein [Pseudomonas petrae]MCF7558929.1 hypothetical protein [Pseudomonas petrae]
MSYDQTGSASVILSDGANITLAVKVSWKTTPTERFDISDAIVSFFHGNAAGLQATLLSISRDQDQILAFANTIKTNFSASAASIISLEVKSYPRNLHSSTVTGVLATGETVRVTFATPDAIPRPPTAGEAQKVLDVLLSTKIDQIPLIRSLIIKALETPNSGWEFIVTSVELVVCCSRSHG